MSAAAILPKPSVITLLVVSPDEQDHLSLRRILEPDCELLRASGRQEAATLMNRHRPRVVICEEILSDGDWRGLLADLQEQQDAPLLIVSSRVADERLWAEVLNLGGFDVLMKPFADLDVYHAVKTATHRSKAPN